MTPFTINRFEIHDGKLAYHDPHSEPQVSIALRDVHVVARNWTNQHDEAAVRPAHAEARARAFRTAEMRAELEADPLATRPDFHLSLESRGVALAELNEFLRAYAGVDVSAGQLDLFFEVDARGGAFEGYLKPLIQGLDVSNPEDSRDPVLARLWEAISGGVAEVLENQPEDQQGARIPIEGRFDEPSLDLFAALRSLLGNAFIEALPARLE